jgi:hypothetical protein
MSVVQIINASANIRDCDNNAQTVCSLQHENRLLMIEIKINIVKVHNYGCVIAWLTIQINFNLQMGAWMRHAG